MQYGQNRYKRKTTNTARLCALLILCLGLGVSLKEAQAVDSKRILVLSAASVGPAIQEIADNFSAATGVEVRISVASSGTLARQIKQGAPADIYVSAATSWVDQLQTEGYLAPDMTLPLARNRLVFVSPASSDAASLIDLSKPLAVAGRLAGGRIAIGDPAHVPAGAYAKEALQNLALWPAVRDHLALQANVRAVLAMVERGETQLGIVYATDAALSSGVRLAAILPSESHSPIIYTAAMLSRSTHAHAAGFFDSLNDAESLDVLEHFGFGVTRIETSGQSPRTGPSIP